MKTTLKTQMSNSYFYHIRYAYINPGWILNSVPVESYFVKASEVLHLTCFGQTSSRKVVFLRGLFKLWQKLANPGANLL